MNYSPPPHRCMSMELFKLGYNTHILKIKMHILGQLETPPRQKNAPPPLLDIPGYAPASYTQFLHNIIIINLNFEPHLLEYSQSHYYITIF